MTLRVRWMTVPVSSASLRTCLARIRSEEYGEGQSSGFRIWEARPDLVEATFIERFDVQDRIEDPFGRSITFPRVEFRTTRFALMTSAPGLQLMNPSRGTRALLTRLGEFLSFAVSMSPIEADVMAWLSAAEKRVGRMVVRRLKASGIHVAAETTGAAEIEGPADVRSHLKELIGRRRCVIDHVVASREVTGVGATIQLSRNGTALLPDSMAPDLLRELRSTLMMSTLEGEREPNGHR